MTLVLEHTSRRRYLFNNIWHRRVTFQWHCWAVSEL